jgi:hypothetical protein
MYHLIVVACFIAWVFLFMPSAVYLFTTWESRFKNLLCHFNDDAVKLYLGKYFSSETLPTHGSLHKFFQKKIRLRYGRCHYVMPMFILIIISGIAIIMIGFSGLKILKITTDEAVLPPIAVSALLGAFMWTAYDQINRFGTGDFTPNDIYRCSFRFLIAVPMGVSFAAVVKDDVGIPLAFFLGTFPAKTLMTFGRRFVTKKLDLGDQAATEKSEMELIQGINKPEAERYQEEGVTTILQLAYMDPIDMTLRTNYDFNYVIDCMSQALLWLYLDKSINIDKLRALGLRGAYEARVLREMLQSENAGQKLIAEANLVEVTKVLDINSAAFLKTLLEVAEDPYTKFIYHIWN